MGPSRFSVQDRHLIPTLHCTLAMCTVLASHYDCPKAKLQLCPSSLSCSCVEGSSVDDLKGQVPRLWNCPTATATESSSVIHESVGNPSSKLPRGIRRGSTTGLQGMERMSLGGELVLVSACLTVTPPITGGQEHTHSHLPRPAD